MSKFISQRDIDELKIKAKASGRPHDMVKLATAKREFAETKDRLFDDEDYPYVLSPDESYLARLEKEAETGDDDAKARFQILKSNRQAVDDGIEGSDVKKTRMSRQQLKQSLESDEKVTDGILQKARELVVRHPNEANRVLYATLKKKQRGQDE